MAAAAGAQPPRAVVAARAVNPHPPAIDGRLDDPCWLHGPWQEGFRQREPVEDAAPGQPTRFQVRFDEKYLYVAIRALDSEPGGIVRRNSRRDSPDGDWVAIDFDSYHDHRTAFCFFVSAAGTRGDSILSGDGEREDSSWDPLWEAKTTIDDGGWSAEMKIPFSQLRFASGNSTWGVLVMRKLFRRDERSMWPLIPRTAPGWVHGFADLEGLGGVHARRPVELLPYALGQAERLPAGDGAPFAGNPGSRAGAGLDGKVGIGSDLTLDFTVNPDFGQVEADPSQVNLTAFETYFQEKRPFFVEGKSIVNFQIMGGDGDFSMDNLFYSRRIGRPPQHRPETAPGEYLDMPESTPILGALKLTGKTRSGWSVGLLDSLTAAGRATIEDGMAPRRLTVEPRTNYFGLRLQRDARGGDTVVGGMLTLVSRAVAGTPLDFLHRSALSGGFDVFRTWRDKTWYVSGNLVFSRVSGSPPAILRTQTSALRYFQRPDAAHLRLDPTRTALAGHGGTVEAGRSGHGRLRFSAGLTWRSPGLELNDMGFLRQADVAMQWSWAGYRFERPFSVFRRLSVSVNQWLGVNFAGERIFSGGNVNLNGQLKNTWYFGLGINRQGTGLSASTLRGGPSLRSDGGWNVWYSVGGDERRRLVGGLSGSFFAGDGDCRSSRFLSVDLTWRPSNALSFTLGPGLERTRNRMQYVATAEVAGTPRYVLAAIDQKTFTLTLRLNVALTPELTVQFYGQPFVSNGGYADFRRVVSPRAPRLADRAPLLGAALAPTGGGLGVDEDGDGVADFTFADPGFRFLQFRSNLVVRWEFRPGSVLFLVWSQGRTAAGAAGDFHLGAGLGDLFATPAGNVFLLKISHGIRL